MPLGPVKLSVLGSGSSGNAVLVWVGETRILVDAGFSGADLARRLEHVGVGPDEIHAIVITHDHGDHTRGMGVFARRFDTPLYMTKATRAASARLLRGGETVRAYRPGRPFEVGEIRVEPFITVHDAADPVGVAVVDPRTGLRLGVATDLGRPTAQIRHALSGCHVLILEANHDAVLLHESDYPVSVKRRIASSHGHLSNEAAATFALELLHEDLVGIILAHLSDRCNRPDLARRVVGDALKQSGWRGHLDVAGQDAPTPLLDVVRLLARRRPSQLELL